MSSFGLLIDPVFCRHKTGPGHPERPERIETLLRAFEQAGLTQQATRIEPTEIDENLLRRVHEPAYIRRLSEACATGRDWIDTPDSRICPESEWVARLAAGGVVEAARRVGRGELRRVFCAVRPPGHHAERDVSMGFCLYSNVALAAEALRAECGVGRLAIVDWDVHHGNGTQHIFEQDPDVLFVSLHGHPDALYPGTGYAHERGRGRGEGATLNVPLEPGTGDGAYRRAFEAQVRPVIERFGPEVVLISCGFDAHKDDPLGILELADETFAWLTDQVLALADRCAQGRIVSVLEGGYDLRTLARCATAHARQLARA